MRTTTGRSVAARASVAGANGAGKSTAAPALLQGALAVDAFVNADVIARGLSAFETTLATRSFAPWLRGLTLSGYDVHLFFLRLSSADLAVRRVADRVRLP